MERDIRDLFDKDEHQKNILPKNHREEFIKKLQKNDFKKPKRTSYFFLKIAASILVIYFCFYSYFSDFSLTDKTAKTEVQIQIELFEKQYLTNINNEWNNFIAIAKDTILIKKYEVKLKESVTDYKNITQKLKEQPDNINVLESLINNLQRRLQLIKNIKEHLKELNQKNTSNETIYL